MQPVVYKWTDQDAPQYNAPNNGSSTDRYNQWKVICQALFVDGYGDKPPIPWDYTFDDAELQVKFTQRIPVGSNVVSKTHLIFAPTSYNKSRLWQFIIEPNINNYAFNYGHLNNNSYNRIPNLFGENLNTDRISPWIVIASNTQIVFIQGINDYKNYPDVPPYLDESRKWSFQMYGSYNTTTGAGITSKNFFGSYADASNDYNNYGLIGSWNRLISSFDGNGSYGMTFKISHDYAGYKVAYNEYPCVIDFIYGNTEKLKYPYIDGGLYMKRFNIVSNGVHYGHINGLYYPLHARPLGKNTYNRGLLEFEGTGEFQGDNFLGLTGSYSEVYFNLSEDWDITE